MRAAKKVLPPPTLPPTATLITVEDATAPASQSSESSQQSQQSAETEVDVTTESDFMKKHGVYSSKAKRDHKLKRDFSHFLKQDDSDTDRLLDYLKTDHEKRMKASVSEPENENTLFCKSLAKQMSALPPEKQALLRLKIQQEVYNCQFGQAPRPSPSHSTAPFTPVRQRPSPFNPIYPPTPTTVHSVPLPDSQASVNSQDFMYNQAETFNYDDQDMHELRTQFPDI